MKYKDGEPCDHVGCSSHASHPCEGCGRIGCVSLSTVYKQRHQELWEWCAENPEQGKDNCPYWEHNGGTWEHIDGLCFACEIDSYAEDDCSTCPVAYWGFDNVKECNVVGSIYHKWNHHRKYNLTKYDRCFLALLISELWG
jgi:hypothetical protein